MLSRQGLVTIKVRALRRKVWFKALSRVERGIIDLTIRCVERIRSRFLEGIVSNIVQKVIESFRSEFLRTVEKIGSKIVNRLVRIAERWGNRNASGWKGDRSFTMFMGTITVNGFGVG